MEKDFLQEFINQATKENEVKIAQEKRKKYFQELGRKGGLKTKENKYNRQSSHTQETRSYRIFIANSVNLESSRITYRYR